MYIFVRLHGVQREKYAAGDQRFGFVIFVSGSGSGSRLDPCKAENCKKNFRKQGIFSALEALSTKLP
jgi:hypothetical protein